jgi:hypothetical protein
MAGTVLGSIKVAIPIGGILIPFLMSTLVKFSSFGISLVLFPLSALLAFLLIYLTLPAQRTIKQTSGFE